MKCIQNNKDKKIIRVSDSHAQKLVELGNYKYVSKSEYKKQQGK
jgi:hypothetical protein